MLEQQAMRRDWDNRARRNAFHYIASWRKDWDLPSFLASGEQDVKNLSDATLVRCGLLPTGHSMIEIGCGAGRMSGSFSSRFEQVFAFDLSREMLSRAREIHAEKSNILWLQGNGADLSCVRSGAVDFVFSYLVLQHLPTERLILQYIQEMLRVLRPGGVFLFQFNGGFTPTMNLRGRLIWGMVDALWSMHLLSASRGLAGLFGLDPAVAGKSWRGPAISAQRVASAVSAGGEVRELRGENTPLAWCCGRKTAGA